MVRRCDDTVDKKRVNSCVLKHLFLERVEKPELIRINSLNNESIKTVRSAVSKNCAERGLFFAASAAKL